MSGAARRGGANAGDAGGGAGGGADSDAVASDELVAIRVIPRARTDEVGGERAGRLVVRTTAAPVDGKANDAVCALVAAHFGVRRRSVDLVSGERSRDKVVRIRRG